MGQETLRPAVVEARKIREARSLGYLDPIIKKLEREIHNRMKPVDPSETNDWHDKRLWDDGAAAFGLELLVWIENRSKTSPDAAENTEE